MDKESLNEEEMQLIKSNSMLKNIKKDCQDVDSIIAQNNTKLVSQDYINKEMREIFGDNYK